MENEKVNIIASIETVAISKSDEKEVVKMLGRGFNVGEGLKHGEVDVRVTNPRIDRHGEQIEPKGVDIKEYKNNPVVLWGHNHNDLPLGQAIKVFKSKDEVIMRVHFDYDIYDFANTVYQMVVRGTIRAVSIGGIVKKWQDDDIEKGIIQEMEMIEFSFVPIGANPDALVLAKSLGMKEKEFEDKYHDFLYKTLSGKLDNSNTDSLKKTIETLKGLTLALEASYKEATVDTNKKVGLKSKKKLIVVRQTAKQCDKLSELVISAINNKLKD